MPGPIALLTDFGEADPYVGMMKGVLLSRFAQAQVVDLTHQVPPQDVRLGAFYLMTSAPYFPEGTLFVCVVDPGVGSQRRILWARSRRRQFLAPDNGLLSWVEREDPFEEVREVTNRLLFLEDVSATFHGRDVFAPVAAELARGAVPAVLGPRVNGLAKRLPFPEPKRARGCLRGTVLAVDRFGNAVTNLPIEGLPKGSRFRCKGVGLGPLRTHYAQIGPGEPAAIAGSSGFVELCVRGGSFSRKHGVEGGDAVEVSG